MQLRTLVGYRAVYCRSCGKQECSSRNKCQCNIIWHQCEEHRIDPIEHKSRKAAKWTKEQKQRRREEEEQTKQARGTRKRKAPEIEEHKIDAKSTIAQKVSKEAEFKRRQTMSDPKHCPKNAKMLEGINKRNELQQKESEELRGKRSSWQGGGRSPSS